MEAVFSIKVERSHYQFKHLIGVLSLYFAICKVIQISIRIFYSGCSSRSLSF